MGIPTKIVSMCVFRFCGWVAAGRGKLPTGSRTCYSGRRLWKQSVVVPRAETAQRNKTDHQDEHREHDPLAPVETAGKVSHTISKSPNLIRHKCFSSFARGRETQS